jgi:phenylacetate-CoA ligase
VSGSGNLPPWNFQSALPGMAWPAVPSGDGAAVLGLLLQLESSQWLSPARLLEHQMSQLDVLVKHAHATAPWYRQRWAGAFDSARPLTTETFSSLPVLTRRELQENFDSLKSDSVPAAHGAVGETRSSGSTGVPVRVLKTQLAALLWNAFTLRDHRWHRRDLRGKLAAIRHGIKEGEFDNWGPATSGLVTTGPSVVMGIRAETDAQLRWLEQQQPEYLMTYPSILRELARRSAERGIRLERLRETRTFGELLAPDIRESCRTAWNVPVTDVYSADEVGYIALQCPQHEHYHVQSEGVVVEVLDESGDPCGPGKVGRVVVTALHNFALPLVRYELGDYAEVGEPCSCGRGLPVLKRIMGRVRNMLVTATGERFWPPLGSRRFFEIAPVVQHQLVQKQPDLIEARLVTASPLSPDQEERLRKLILSGLPAGIRLAFAYCENIPRSSGGKFEDFISEVAVAPRP